MPRPATASLKRLKDFQMFRDKQIPNVDILELVTEDEQFLCLVTRQDFLDLSNAFRKHVEKMDEEKKA